MVFDECYNALPVFLEETSSILEKNTVNGVTAMWREQIYNEDFSPDIDLTIPMDGVKQLTDILRSMEKDTKAMLDRFSKISPVDDEKIKNVGDAYVRWRRVNELTDLKLQYVGSFVDKVQKSCEAVLDGESIKKHIEKYRDAMTLRNLKSNVVKTDIPYYMTPKDMLNVQNEERIPFTRETLSNTFVCFLLEFYNVRLRGSNSTYKESSFGAVTNSIKKEFTSAITRIQMLKASLLNTVDSYSIPDVEKMFYAVNMILLQLAQYVIAVYMRTLTSYVYDMRELMRIVSLMDMKRGDVSSVVTESVVSIMDTCTVEKPSNLMKAVSNLMDSMKNIGLVTKDLKGIEDGACDPYTYTFPIKTLGVLDGRLRSLMLLCRDDADSANQEILSDAHLSENEVKELFSDVSRAENMNFLKSVEYNPDFIYQDLILMETYIPKIADAVNHMKSGVISAYIRGLESNVNNVFPNGMRNKETVEFLQELMERVSEYARELGKSYVRRLKEIGNILKIDSDVEIEFEPENYFADAIASSYRVIKEDCDPISEVNRRYQNEFISKTVGKSFFEADENQNGNNQNGDGQNGSNGNNNQNQNKDQNQNGSNTPNNSKDGQKSDKPVVHDGGDQNQNNQNQNGNNQNGDGKSEPKGLASIKSFISGIIEKMNNWIKSKDGQKNKNFIANNKNYLLNRNYTNTSIEILPFKQNFQPIKTLETLTKNVIAIDANTLKTADEKTMINKVFGGFKLPPNTTMDNLDDALLQSIKYGSTNVEKMTVSDGALKTMMPGVISFLEMYYGEFTTKLQDFEDRSLGKLDTFFQLANLVKGKSDENDRLLDNLSLATNLIKSGIGSVRNASKDIAGDYMQIISALAQSNPDNKKK